MRLLAPGFLGVLLLITIFSCQKEASVESGNTPDDPLQNGTTGNNTDHLPLTNNSWWSYDSPDVPVDTGKLSVVGTKQIAGNSYKAIKTEDSDGTVDTSFLRKSGNDYYFYGSEDTYSLVSFDDVKLSPILFMKENLSKGATWTSPVYSGKMQGQPVNIRYNYKCDDNNATVKIGAHTFNNVYKIVITSQVSVNGLPFANELITEEYYAKGVGKIYQKNTLNNTAGFELQIRYWKVF